MPFAGYKNFAECVRKNRGKGDPKAYCATIMRKAEGPTKLLPEEWRVSKEQVTARVTDVFDIKEAEFDDEKMEAKVTILREGRSKNRRNYTKRVLREAVSDGIFNNMRMFIDHADRPPVSRSLRELVSATGITAYEEDEQGGKIVGPVRFFNREFYDFTKQAKEYMGDSISANLRVNRYRQPDGQIYEDVQKIMKGYSVDWVVFPAAGGGIEQFMTEAEGEAPVEWDEITEDMLKEHNPKLYAAITASKEQEDPDDGDDGDDDDDEKKDEEGAVTYAGLEALIAEKVLEERQKWDDELEERVEAERQVAVMVDSSTLPDLVKARLKRGFKGRKFDRVAVKESIDEAKKELREAGAGPRVTGMGVTAASGGTRKLAGHAEEAVAAALGYKPASQAEKN